MSSETQSDGNEVSSPSHSPREEKPAEKRMTSRFRGVCWNRKNRRWQSAINRAGRYIYLGSFVDEEDAARQFDRAAVKLRGPAAKLNYAFSDYPAEMQWHRWHAQTGNATEAVLRNPKVLRERIDPASTHDMLLPFRQNGFADPLLFPTPSPCTFNNILYTYEATGCVEPLRGRVIDQAQENRMMSPLYFYPLPGDNGIDHCSMTSNLFVSGDHGMLVPSSGHYPTTTAPFHLAEPAIKPEPVSTQPLTANDVVLPVVNFPEGAAITHMLKGPHNSFAMGFVRRETTNTEVLLYDGRAMHEVGSFSSREDAAQTCQSLLGILTKIRNGDAANAQIPTSSVMSPSLRPASVDVHKALDAEEGEYQEELKGKSPFDIPPGSQPSFDSQTAEEARCDIMMNADRPDIELAKTDRKHSKSAPLENRVESLKQRMGSLLDPSISVRQLEDLAPQPTTSGPAESKKEASVRIRSSLSLTNSGSLKNILAVFNQSGNFSIIRREEGDDDDAIEEVQLPTSDTAFPTMEVAIPMETSSVNGMGLTAYPVQFDTQYPKSPESITAAGDALSPFGKRKASEMPESIHTGKRMKDVIDAGNLS